MFTRKLDSIGKNDINAGSKAACLGELSKSGLPVPQGFVLLSDAFEKFLAANRIKGKVENLFSQAEIRDIGSLKNISLQIQGVIKSAPFPEFIARDVKESYDELSVGKEVREIGGVALDMIKAGRGNEYVSVRPSAVSTLPGLDSYVQSQFNVIGPQSLLEAIKDCWAAFFGFGPMFYMKSRGSSSVPMISVIVQKMVNTDKAGSMFTCDPLTSNAFNLLVEGSWGLGESVSCGVVTPDRYVVEKNTGNVLEKRISKKFWMKVKDPVSGRVIKESTPRERVNAELLNEKELSKLWEMSRRVEEIFSPSQEIGWGIERNRMFLLHARPVQIASRNPEGENINKGKVILSGIPASAGTATGCARIILNPADADGLQEGDIAVVKNLSIELVPLMNRAIGIISDDGGASSKAASAARESGIPVITGTETATTVLQNGQKILINAFEGEVCEPEPEAAPRAPDMAGPDSPAFLEDDSRKQGPSPGGPFPAAYEMPESGPTATEIRINLGFPRLNPEHAGASDGVGILRAENMLTESGANPFQAARRNPEELSERIYQAVSRLAKAIYPKPLWYRSLDMRTDELRALPGGEQECEESNPVLGWHGIRRSLDCPETLECEIKALRRLYHEGAKNVSLLLPFVSRVEEVIRVRGMIDFPMKLGIVVETPSSAIRIGDFCREGISLVMIDLDGLAQLTLGIDRNNERLSGMYSDLEPSVISLIRHITRTCSRHGVHTSVFGEGVMRPEVAEKMVELGTNSLSVDPDAIEGTKTAVTRAERKLLLEKARDRRGLGL